MWKQYMQCTPSHLPGRKLKQLLAKTSKIMNKLLFALLCFVSYNSKAQDTLKILPGSKEILYSKIKSHVIKSRFKATRNNETKDLGVYKDSIAFVKRGGEEFLVRYSFFPARNLFDTAFYQAKTL